MTQFAVYHRLSRGLSRAYVTLNNRWRCIDHWINIIRSHCLFYLTIEIIEKCTYCSQRKLSIHFELGIENYWITQNNIINQKMKPKVENALLARLKGSRSYGHLPTIFAPIFYYSKLFWKVLRTNLMIISWYFIHKH